MNLLELYQSIITTQPDLANADIDDYCIQSNQLAQHRQDPLNFGINSLKWVLYQVQAIEPRRVKHVFKAILIEHKAFQKTLTDLQFHILKYAAVAEYKARIRQNTSQKVNLEDLPLLKVGEWNIVINTTGLNLTSLIMRRTNADAILFYEPDQRKAGLQIRVNSRLNLLNGFKQYFFDRVNNIESGWMFHGDYKNLIINHGHASHTPSGLTIDDLSKIITNYFTE